MIRKPNEAAAAAISGSDTTSDNVEEECDTADGEIVNLVGNIEQKDLISDSGDEAGQDEDMPPDGLPQDHRNVMSSLDCLGSPPHDNYSLQRLALSTDEGIMRKGNEDEAQHHGIEWRKLGSDHAPHGLRQKIANPQVVAAASSDPTPSSSTLRSCIVGKVDWKFVTKRDPSIPVLPTKPLLIQDILQENSRLFDQPPHKQQLPETMSHHPVNDEMTAATVVSGLLELGSQDLDLTSIEKERRRKRDTETKQVIVTEELQRKAIIACTAGNM